MSDADSQFAFVFPGQGSQAVGMLSALAETHSEVLDTFTEASDALGFDLWQIVAVGPEAELNRTEITQPALLAASVAVWRILSRGLGRGPAWVAGHSLGEYSALVCAGVLDFSDAVRLVHERGCAMQQAVPSGVGAMAAILGLDDAAIVALCSEVARPDFSVSAANFNAPGQVVIAGHAEAVKRLVELAKGQGAKRAIVLPVSVPSHCDLMRPAAERLGVLLAALPIGLPAIPVLHNVDVASHCDAADIRTALIEQLYSPVRWTESVQAMAQAGVTHFVECGPGKVLSGLNKRIVPGCDVSSVNDPESLNKAVELLS